MKYYGRIGFMVTEEEPDNPSVYSEKLVYKTYSGDVERNMTKWSSSDKLNDDLNVSNSVSIVADPFAYNHSSSIRCIEFMGSLWKVDSVTVRFPRLVLSIGGVYNGPQTNSG